MGLVTRQNVKDYLEMRNADSDDNELISELIERVTTEMETFCNRTFASTESTEYVSGEDYPILYMRGNPITSVSGIWVDSSLIWDDDALLVTGDYVVFEDFIQGADYTFPAGINNIKVIYTHGYSTIPGDLKQVCIEEVGRKFKHTTDYDVISKTTKFGESVYVEKSFLKRSLLVMKKYRHVGIG